MFYPKRCITSERGDRVNGLIRTWVLELSPYTWAAALLGELCVGYIIFSQHAKISNKQSKPEDTYVDVSL